MSSLSQIWIKYFIGFRILQRSWTLILSTDAIAFWVLCSVGSLPRNPVFDPFEDDCGDQLLFKQFSIWELLMTKKFLQISSNLFSTAYVFKTRSEEFHWKRRTSIQSRLSKGILKLKIKNIIKLPGTWVDAISTMIYMINFWVISLETESGQSGCSNFRLWNT